ncbi:MAG TPA: Ig domain-containing protein [Candidatus Acidoferrales bacterium]|nr:Ig domain-containing protein [Candidatus Acidoferrales bacterium]
MAITTTALPTTQPMMSYKVLLNATGGQTPYLWSITSGSLPPGISLTGATGTIAGKATVAGNYTFTVQVQDSASPTTSATQALQVSVVTPGSALKISTVNLPAGQVGVAYSTAATATGGTAPYTWSITSGALPVGLVLSAATGGIAGTPTQSGQSTFTLAVKDSTGLSAQQSLNIQIGTTQPQSSLQINTTSLLGGVVGQGYSVALQASGGVPGYSWSVTSGQFPPGLAIDSASGAIGGVPTATGQFSFTVQVNDSAMPPNTATQTLSITISSNTSGNVGPGSTMAGGLLALPPSRQLGSNILPNGNMQNGNTGWYIPTCWSMDSTVAYTGASASLKYAAGSSCASAAYAPNFVFQANTSYTIGAWVKASVGSNLEAQIKLADGTDSGLSVGGNSPVTVGTNWTYISVPDFDMLPLHNGDNIEARLVVSAPSGQTPSGTVWFSDVTAQPEMPLPISTFLLYPNFRGYLWQTGSQIIRLHVEAGTPSGMTAQIVLQTEGGSIVNTVQQAAQATQEIDIDGTSLALGSYLIHTNLLDSTGAVVSSYPDYRVTKVSSTFQASLVNYIDTDNFLVHNGQKEFVWGVYDRTSSIRCSLCMYTTAAAYDNNIAGFNNLGTIGNYGDTQLNAMTNFAPWSAMSPGPPAVYDQLDPAMQALQSEGVGYLQTVNNWISGNQYRPFWATSLTDPQLWQLAASMMAGKSGGLGYYTYDEPKLGMLPGVFAQYQTLRQYNPGSVAWGALITADQIYRWRDISDVTGCDPYPIGVPVGADEYAVGAPEVAATSSLYIAPTVRVSLWTEGSEQQVFKSRPVWAVLQLWRQWGQFPTYAEMKQSAYKAIIGGANGIMWWGFVSGAGIEEEWYQRQNYQAYFDFKQLSGEVQALQSYLISPPQPQDLSSVSSNQIETRVKASPTQVVIFATSDSASAVNNVTFNLASIVTPSNSTVTVYSENRTLNLSGLSFTDSFAPYDAHVYIITLQ